MTAKEEILSLFDNKSRFSPKDIIERLPHIPAFQYLKGAIGRIQMAS